MKLARLLTIIFLVFYCSIIAYDLFKPLGTEFDYSNTISIEEYSELKQLSQQFTQDLISSNNLLREINTETDQDSRKSLEANVKNLELRYNDLCSQYNKRISKLLETPIDLPHTCTILEISN